MRKIFFVVILTFICTGLVFAQGGVKKKRPLPHEYARIVINNYSDKAGLSPVVFDHWLHRAQFTCRLCHVDLGFAMKAGATGIKASDNISGYYCGTCHNGKKAVEDRKVFEACAKMASAEEAKQCERCHSLGKQVKRIYDFQKFAGKFPKERMGNGVDWERAEAEGHIRPVDYLEGVSIKRPALGVQKDFTLGATVEGMPEIIFSHKKHTVWNGCELCHPELFVGVKKGATKYSMIEIFDGKYCGVCHSTVAFPLQDCGRCHTKPVGA